MSIKITNTINMRIIKMKDYVKTCPLVVPLNFKRERILNMRDFQKRENPFRSN